MEEKYFVDSMSDYFDDELVEEDFEETQEFYVDFSNEQYEDKRANIEIIEYEVKN